MKILAVDDSSVMRRIMGNAVQLLGYELLEAGDGVSALKILEKEYENIALILLDWNMPQMNGPEFIKYYKADDRFKNIPFMMVTTESDRQNVISAVKMGAINYLCKPFTQQDLTIKIMESLE